MRNVNIHRSKTSYVLKIGIITVAIILIISLGLSTLGPYPVMIVKGLHINAAYLAMSICPINECDVKLGWGTRELSVNLSSQILQRWCVEVLYKKMITEEKGEAAVEIILTDRDNDNPDNWKIVNVEYRVDCSVMK